MDAREVLRRFGGAARLGQILRYSTQHSLRQAVARQDVRRVTRGVYALVETPRAYRAAVASNGLVSHTSAAAHWLMETLTTDPVAHVTVPKHGRYQSLRGVKVHFNDVDPADDHGGVTSPRRTVLDCATLLPFADALAIADSALRRDLVTADALIAAASGRRGP